MWCGGPGQRHKAEWSQCTGVYSRWVRGMRAAVVTRGCLITTARKYRQGNRRCIAHVVRMPIKGMPTRCLSAFFLIDTGSLPCVDALAWHRRRTPSSKFISFKKALNNVLLCPLPSGLSHALSRALLIRRDPSSPLLLRGCEKTARHLCLICFFLTPSRVITAEPRE